jgi:hypothetical protein
MKLLTPRIKASETAEAWKLQYRIGSGSDVESDKVDVHNGLVALGLSPDPVDVDRIIGNKTWTSLHCHECDESCDVAVRLGEDPDYESSTARICLACLRKALALAESVATTAVE